MEQVSVDANFARFGGKSYAINKINSVEVRTHKPHGEGAIWACGLIALLCLLVFIGSLSALEGPSVVTLVIGAIFGGLAYRAWRNSKIREYQLFLMTSSSEAQAFVTRNRDEVFALRDSIEKAMAAS